MSIIKYLYKKGSLKRKKIDIEDDITSLIKPVCKEDFFVTSYGAFNINPQYLVYWICVKTDKANVALHNN